MFCVWQKKKSVAVTTLQPKHPTQLLAWGFLKNINCLSITFDYICFSPCSGLVVSGYSKRQSDKSLETYMNLASEQYKNYKNIIKGEIGNKIIQFIF